MDPLLVFPPEIVHQIWRYFTPEELLPVRAVARQWLASVTAYPDAWLTDFSNDWDEYLEVKKTFAKWKSAHFKHRRFHNIKEVLTIEIAFYVLFEDGSLKMFSSSGNFVRAFDKPVMNMHKGQNCLLLGVHYVNKLTGSGTVVDSGSRYDTLIVDFVLNVMDTMEDAYVTVSSPHGMAYFHHDQFFLEIGGCKIASTPNLDFFFMPSFVVSIRKDFVNKSILFYGINSSAFVTLKSFASSPRCIPKIDIIPGPKNFFCVLADQREYKNMYVYHERSLIHQECQDFGIGCFFTEDYLFVSLKKGISIFYLDHSDFQCNTVKNLNVTKVVKVNCDPYSLMKNCFVSFEPVSPKTICCSFQKVSSVHEMELISRKQFNIDLKVTDYEFWPHYAVAFEPQLNSSVFKVVNFKN